MIHWGELFYCGEVGGEGVGGLFDYDDLIRICGGCVESLAVVEEVVSAVEEVVAAVEEVAPDEITGAKMRVSRGGSSSLLSTKWMKSALFWPPRLFKTRNVCRSCTPHWRAVV